MFLTVGQIHDAKWHRPGRFIDGESHEVGQIARYEGGDLAASVAAIRKLHAAPATKPDSVAVLGKEYLFDAIDRRSGTVSNDGLVVPIGINATSLDTTWFSLGSSEHGLVLGGSGSGKSTTLALLAAAIRAVDPTIPIVGVAHRRSALQTSAALTALVGRQTPPERLAELIDHDHVVVLIDDADTTPGPLVEVLSAAASTHVDGRHLIAACRTDYPKDFEAWVQGLRRDQTGIILRPSPNDGDSLRTMLPMYRPERYPVGRGYVVVGSVPELAQLTMPPTEIVEHVEETGNTSQVGASVKPIDAAGSAGTPARVETTSVDADRPAGAKISLGLDSFTTNPEPAAVDDDDAWQAAPRKIDLGLSDDED